ncbi:hypothetical protein FRB96_008513 [Tulasnella sp. 330]|nr:hypothetical protein FRB96_008513 [Tulasnella sp. 330]KAG8877515.1 hypothetical protein FRB97_003378 [Tulasnella sp. 331]KAG8882948.1 hypothetical protein FRB98_003379 [Tulasnella sp. 332]
MPYTILVGGYSDFISTLSFDPTISPATLKVVGTSPAGSRPTWISRHPTDKSLIFATNEQVEGKVLLFTIKPDQTLDLVQTVPSGGAAPCHLHIGEGEVVAANFSSGTVLAIPLSLSPPALLEPHSEPIHFEFPGPGPKPNQEWSHPHQIFPHPSGKELLVPDLGGDKIWRLGRDEEGKPWKINGAIESPARGTGPRHAIFKGDDLYVINELTSTLTHYSYPNEGDVKEVNTLSILRSQDQFVDNMLGAALLLSEPSQSFPEPLIYVSNRNDLHPEGDTIAIFKPATAFSGVELVGEVRTGLHHIRGVALGGEEDRYLVVGGVTGGSNLPKGIKGGGIKVFERVDRGRSLKEVAHLEEEHVALPTSFLIL